MLRAYKEAPIESLVPYASNARTHSDEQVAQIAASIREFGWTNPVLVDGQNGVIAGHGRLLAARKLGMTTVPVLELSDLTPAQRKAYVLADNKLALNAGWDLDLLKLELADLQGMDFDLGLVGFSPEELDKLLAPEGGGSGAGEGSGQTLAERFGIPPFSVFNAREGWWQDRKRGWLALGIKSEEGRDALSYKDQSGLDRIRIAAPGGSNMVAGYTADGKRETGLITENGTSVFDPVLCELSYRWFCPPEGLVLDPFAGGSVRGIVASKLGRQYVGVDLRPEQIAANRQQAEEICVDPMPIWHEGDSRNIERIADGVAADFLFSCPPYADLERYSDDPRDLSTLDYKEFRAAYEDIIKVSARMLKLDRFACFVVGDVRDKRGAYYSFPWHTIAAFEAAGLRLYNEAVLVTAVGSLPIRAGKQFAASRKLGKTHQNVLVFVKGDPLRATQAVGQVEFGELDEAEAGSEAR